MDVVRRDSGLIFLFTLSENKSGGFWQFAIWYWRFPYVRKEHLWNRREALSVSL